MRTELQQRFFDAVTTCLRPLARMLMRAGITYSQFDEMAKRAFVDESFRMKDIGRAMNTSRVAVRTGLSRKEVARIRQEIATGETGVSPYQIGRPARALQLWYSDRDFLDEFGNPIDLAFDGVGPSFTALVRRVGGDVPAGAVRSELLSAGGMIELPNGRFRAQKRFFVPSAFHEDVVVGFAFIVGPLLETLEHNLEYPTRAFIQRVSYSDHLPESARQEFSERSHKQAEMLMQHADEWLAQNEDKSGPAEDETRRIGLGVFFFDRASSPTEKREGPDR